MSDSEESKKYERYAGYFLIVAASVFVFMLAYFAVTYDSSPPRKFNVGQKVKFKLDGRIGMVSEANPNEEGSIKVRINRKIHFWNDSFPYEELLVKPEELERSDE